MDRIARILKVRPGEGRSAVLLVALMFLVSAGGSIGGNGIDTLFFSRFGVRFLPQMYIALGVVTFIVALAVTVLLSRVTPQRLFVLLPLVLAAVLGLERALVSAGPRWGYAVIWLAMNVIGGLQALLAWGLAGVVCDTRQAKRLFPLFGAGGILGAVLGGLGTPPLVKLIHVDNLLLVWGATLVAAFTIATLLARLGAPQAAPVRRAKRRRTGVLKEMQHGYRTVRGSEFLRWIAIGAAIFAILQYSIAFPFSKAATAHYPNEEQLAGFLGLFQGISTGLALLVSLLVANRLFARFGVMRMVVAFPAIYVAGFTLLTLTNRFPIVVSFRLIQMVWMMGVFASASQAAYNVVSPARKDQVRVFMDGVPAQAGTLAAGVLLLVGQEQLPTRALFAIGLAAAAIGLPVAWRAARAYRAALVDALREGRPQVFFPEEQPFGGFQRDSVAVQAAVAGVTDPDRTIRKVSAEILGRLAVPEATDALVRALKDRDPPVRVAALRGLVRAGASHALLEVAGRVRDPEPAVRLAAITALRELAPYPAGVARETRSLLSDEDPAVRARAAAALLDIGTDPDAAKVLREMTRAEDDHVRREAVAAARHPELLTAALADPSTVVREAAARAMASLDPNTSVPALVPVLGDPATPVRRAAAETLAAIGGPAIDPALAALDDPSLEIGALDTLERIPTLPVAPVERYARAAGARALRYGTLWRAAERSGSGERTALLADALRARAVDHAMRAVRGAGLLTDRRATAVAVENLASTDPAQRANALEMLEASGPRDLIAPLLTLWEVPDGEPVPDEEWLQEVLDDSDPWLAACASAAADEAGGTSPARTLSGGGAVETLDTLSVIERVLLLRRVPLFTALPPDELRRLADIATEHVFEAGEALAEEGDPGEEMFVLAAGQVGVVLDLGTKDEREVARHGPGAHVGEMAAIAGEPRSASLVAREDVRALVVDRAHFESLLRERPDVGLALMRTLVDRIRESNRLLPRDLAARSAAAAPRLAGERRVVTMLFCDVVGSTSMAERLDPEEWADIVEEAYASLVKPVEQYGGSLAQFMGDAILAIFGAPVAHDDDAERAVRAGLDMLRAVAPLKERLSEKNLAFDLRVGINTGLVRAGGFGPDSRLDYTALGDAVNVAARMEQSASPGTVQISESTARLVAPLFELEDLGAVNVKGKAEPVRSHRVLRAKPQPGRVRGIEGLVSPLVGRDRESSRLAELVGAVEAGQGRVVTLVGEAGLGKSRMIEELRTAWEANGSARWLHARAISYETNRPYAVVQQLVRNVIRADLEEPPVDLRAKLASFTDEITPSDPERARAVLALLLGIDSPHADEEGDHEEPSLSHGEELKREVLATVYEAFRSWAARGPATIVADDLHWCDPASLEVLLHLLPLSAETPILFVYACRPDPPTLPAQIATAAGEAATTMSLAPLEADETSTLLGQLLQIRDLPESLRRSVVDKAAGNPLFVEETLRSLMDAGAVVREEGGWRIAAAADVSIPDHLHGLLGARIDALEPGPRRTLQLASVIGRSFGYRILKSIGDAPEDIGDHLDKLERAGLIVETAEVPDLEFGFRHPLLRDAAYRSMLNRERRAHHSRVAETLERDLAERDDEAATLAHHFDEAGDAAKALRYRTAAARHAHRLFAHPEAISQFERALELANESAAATTELRALYEGLGLCLRQFGKNPDALKVYEEMERAARSRADRAMELAAVTAQATVRSIPSEAQDPELAMRLLDRSLELATALGDRAAEARAHHNRMLLLQFTGHQIEESTYHGERALAIARELHLEDLIAYALHDLADSLLFLGRPDDGWRARAESEALFERQGNLTMLADSLARHGHMLLVAGRYGEALPSLERALEIDRRIGSPWGVGYALFVRTHILWELGDPDKALQDGDRLVEVATSASQLIKVGGASDRGIMLGELGAVARGLEQVRMGLEAAQGIPHLQAWALGSHARLLGLDGQPAEAERTARAAREALPPPGGLLYFHMKSVVSIAQAEVALAGGDAKGALEVLEELSDYMAERALHWRLGDVSLLRARALTVLGRRDEAETLLAGARRTIEETNARRSLWLVLAALAELAEQRGDASRAEDIRARARDVLAVVLQSLTDPELRSSFTALPAVRALL
jgi:class 3 adenylate cyclase/HEAT repeat protein/tetratricopeptide (TPR) repeat protein